MSIASQIAFFLVLSHSALLRRSCFLSRIGTCSYASWAKTPENYWVLLPVCKEESERKNITGGKIANINHTFVIAVLIAFCFLVL